MREYRQQQHQAELARIQQQKRQLLQGRKTIAERVAEQEAHARRLVAERYQQELEEERRRLGHLSPRMKLIQVLLLSLMGDHAPYGR